MEFDRQLRKLRAATVRRGHNLEANLYKNARNTLRESVLGPDGTAITDALKNLDADYRKFVVAQEGRHGPACITERPRVCPGRVVEFG